MTLTTKGAKEGTECTKENEVLFVKTPLSVNRLGELYGLCFNHEGHKGRHGMHKGNEVLFVKNALPVNRLGELVWFMFLTTKGTKEGTECTK